ncbi:AAA family ATPase [Methylococcaceae bacterium WWC4]|nr:AAA family ATPase [Methylococcaceae bacterium WWC4]
MTTKTKNRVHIFGDIHNDVFKLAKTSEQSSPEKGGILFVEKTLKSKGLTPDNGIEIISNYIMTVDINQEDQNLNENYIQIGPLFNYVWDCDYYKDDSEKPMDKWVLRCKEQIDVKKEPVDSSDLVILDKTIFKKYSYDANDFFIFECCGKIGLQSGGQYKGVFFDKTISGEIIKTISDKFPEPTDKALMPRFFWIFHNEIPPFFTNTRGFESYMSLPRKSDNKLINKELVARTIVFLNSNVLRKMGIYIQTHVSWESIANDYICALYSNPLMEVFKQYRHVIVRFGISGAIYSYKSGKNNRWLHRLVFDPFAEKTGLVRDAATQGDIVGYQTVFTTCVLDEVIGYVDRLQKIEEADAAELSDNICDGIRKALASIQKLFREGLGSEICTDKNLKPTHIGSISKYWSNFNTNFHKVFDEVEKNKLAWRKFGHELIPVANPGWTIMVQSAEYDLFNKALTLVSLGVEKAFNNTNKLQANDSEEHIAWAPVITFGKNNDLIVIDRREIENYRMIHGLINRHINETSKKPLSIVVFGPPGSGKSFTVTKIVESANSSQFKTDMHTINLTTINDKQMLEDEIAKACKSYFYENIPVVFFDEFDSKHKNEDLAWLKMFLSPMEDWKAKDLIDKASSFFIQDQYQIISALDQEIEKLNAKIKVLDGKLGELDQGSEDYITYSEQRRSNKKLLTDNEDSRKKSIKILEDHDEKVKITHKQFDDKHPIFVFAGGTSHNYRDFIHADDLLSEEQKLKFAMAKGPDFVSRLRGHIDILGPNRVDDHDDGYVIRRAILLRGMLLDRFSLEKLDDLTDYIDEAVVKAMLRVSTFTHGARSMRAIINMSDTIGGNKPKLVSSTLPTLPQLNMHVNGKEFIEMIKNES